MSVLAMPPLVGWSIFLALFLLLPCVSLWISLQTLKGVRKNGSDSAEGFQALLKEEREGLLAVRHAIENLPTKRFETFSLPDPPKSGAPA